MRQQLRLLIACGFLAACQGDVDELGDLSDGKADAVSTSGPLRFTEAMVQPRSGKQWVELINTGGQPLDLTTFAFASRTTARSRFKAAVGHPSSVPPNALALLVESEATLATVPDWLPAAVSTTGRLGSHLRPIDALRLFDSSGKLVEQAVIKNAGIVDISVERQNTISSTWTSSPFGSAFAA